MKRILGISDEEKARRQRIKEKIKERVIWILLIIGSFSLCAGCTVCTIYSEEHYVEYTINLSELEDGVVLIKQPVIVDNNRAYDLLTFIDDNNQVITIKSYATINNIDTESPYLIWQQKEYSREPDKIIVYAPTSSVRNVGAISMK